MSSNAEVEAAQSITAQGVSSTLKNDACGLVEVHHLVDNWLEKVLVTLVINAIPQGYIETVVAATLCSNFIHVTCAGEEVVSIFVEGHCHDPVSEVEGFLDPVTMVDVNINVEHPRVVLEQLQDANHNVIDIAEARSLKLLGMVQTSSPVDGNITDLVVQLGCSLQRCACVTGTELKEPGKHWAVIAHVEGIKALGEALHIGGAHSLQEVNVVLGVEAAHVMLRGLVWLEDLRTETQGESRQGQPQSWSRDHPH